MNQRKRCLLGMILLSSLAVCGCGPTQAITPDKTSSPGLVVEPMEIDLGKCRIGVAKPFSSELVNYGKEPVELARVEPSCGCTNVQISGDHCEPGERITLSGSVRGENKAGKFRHRITIREAVPTQREHMLMLVGVVEPTIKVSPDTAILVPSLTEAKEGEAVLAVTNTGDETIHLQKPVRLPDGVTGEVEKAELKPNEKTKLVLKVGFSQLSELDAEPALPTSHPLENLINFSVKVRPKEGIRVLPSSVRLGVASKSSLLKSNPLVIRLTGEIIPLVEVTDVACPEFLQCERMPEQSGIVLRFTVVDRFPGIDLKSRIELKWKLRTPKPGLPQELSIEIPVSGILTEA